MLTTKGYAARDQPHDWDDSNLAAVEIRICHFCNRPTIFQPDEPQLPAPKRVFGNGVAHVPELVNAVYEEARRCVSLDASTAAAMLCHKVIANVAVHLWGERAEDLP